MTNENILDSQSTRTTGSDAFTSNILAIKALSEIVKTTLGPYGMDKMLIDSLGNSIITNDGVQILKSMDIAHPAAELIVEIAKTQDKNIGDGTTSTVILIAQILEEALELYNQNIHPNNIVTIFTNCCNYILNQLEKYSIDISKDLKKYLIQIIKTAMRGKSSENNSEYLSQLLVDKIISTPKFSKENIKCLKVIGPSIDNSQIIQGIVFDKKKLHQSMPNSIKNPKILLCSCPIEVQEIENVHQIQLNSYKDYEDFIIQEKQYLQDISNQIIQLGINVVISQKGVDDNVVSYLAKNGILVLRRCRKSDLEKLSQASKNTPILQNLDHLSKEYICEIGSVDVLEIAQEELISFSVKDSNQFSIIITATTMHVLDEIERALEDSIGDISNVLKHKKIVGGGGAIECSIYNELMIYSKTLQGKEQLIAESFAKSFLSIPKTLSKNCGLDELEIISNLKHMHSNNKQFSGINSSLGVVENVIELGIIEPLGVVEQIILNSKEAISMILRIDDIIAAKKIDLESSNLNDI